MSPTISLALAVMVFSGAVTFFILFPIRRFASRLGFLDRPGGHSSHRAVTPLGGGVGIFAGVLAAMIVITLGSASHDVSGAPTVHQFVPDTVMPVSWTETIATHAIGVRSRMNEVWWLMAGCGVLVTLGVLDDRYGLPVAVRLGIQFAIATIAVFGLQIELTVYLTEPWVTKCLSVLWIVAVINSFNMLDNMDALSGGIAAIIAGSMAVVMWTTPDPGTDRPQFFVAGLLLIVAGACLGFLFHNRPPARVFMGDGGSYLVGFLIAVAMLMATYAGGKTIETFRPHAVLAPLCAMAVPLYDMTTVLWIRMREGRSPFVGDQSHLSHRLVDLGLSRSGAVATIHLVTATCGLSAMVLTHVPLLQAMAVLGIVVCMLTLLAILESTAWRRGRS
ncbi:MAG: MraY family glycosyltransferase [Planctomycetota bacterium]